MSQFTLTSRSLSMSATHMTDSTTATAPVLYLAFELGWTTWKLAFTIGAGQKPRIRSMPARAVNSLMLEIHAPRRHPPHARNPRRPTPVRTSRPDAGHLLLRGRPRRLLAPSLPRASGHREPHRRCRFHRGQPPAAPRQVGQPRRHQARGHAHPLAPRREEALGGGPRPLGRRRG